MSKKVSTFPSSLPANPLSRFEYATALNVASVPWSVIDAAVLLPVRSATTVQSAPAYEVGASAVEAALAVSQR